MSPAKWALCLHWEVPDHEETDIFLLGKWSILINDNVSDKPLPVTNFVPYNASEVWKSHKRGGKWRKSNFVVLSLTCVRIFVIPWTVAHQAPLSMEFSRQEYWSGLSFPSSGDLPNPGIEPTSAWQVDSFPLSHLGSPTWEKKGVIPSVLEGPLSNPYPHVECLLINFVSITECRKTRSLLIHTV